MENFYGLAHQDALDIANWLIRTRPLAQAVRVAFHGGSERPSSVTWREGGGTRELASLDAAIRFGWNG